MAETRGTAERFYVALVDGDGATVTSMLDESFTGRVTEGMPLGVGGAIANPEQILGVLIALSQALAGMSTAFLLTALVIVATPGTGALYTIGTGLARGTKASILAAFACTLGTLPHLVAANTGLAAVLQASGLAFAAIKYAGVAYLLYMAWMTWRDKGALAVEAEETRASARSVITSGITLNLLNPKLSIFFFAFLPQFVPNGAGAVATMLGLSAVFMLLTFVVFSGYGAFAAGMRDQVLSRPRVLSAMRKVFAATFVALAVRLAVQSH